MIPGISTGGGGLNADLGGGPSSAGGGRAGSAGGQQFNFDTPASIKAAKGINVPMIAGIAVVGLWLLTRK